MMRMRGFKWNAAHALNIPEIDAEHRAIYQAVMEMQQAFDGKATPKRMAEALRGLAAVMEDHFAHEERLMQTSRYLSQNWHRQQHDAARKRLKHYGALLEKGDREAAAVLLDFVGGWLRDHLAVADRMMGAYLRNYQRSHAA